MSVYVICCNVQDCLSYAVIFKAVHLMLKVSRVSVLFCYFQGFSVFNAVKIQTVCLTLKCSLLSLSYFMYNAPECLTYAVLIQTKCCNDPDCLSYT